jgi:hypothetical protein
VKKCGSKRGGKRKQKRRGIRVESGDRALVTCSSGMSYVIGKATPLGFLQTRSDVWDEWQEEEVEGGGWVLHKKGEKEGYLITNDDFAETLRAFAESAKETLESLDPVQRQFLRDQGKLERVEARLKKPFWKTLRKTSPSLYVALVRSMMRDKRNKTQIEQIEADLSKFGLGWEKLRAVKRLGEGQLALARVSRSIAAEKEKSGSKRWRRYDPAVKHISSSTSPFSEGLKKRLQKEHLRVKSMTPFERSVAESFQDNVEVAVRQILGGDIRHVNTRLPWDAIVSCVISIVIVRMVDELLAVGFSKRRSCAVADRILRVMLPAYWPEPNEFSPDRVRRRYYYWSKEICG